MVYVSGSLLLNHKILKISSTKILFSFGKFALNYSSKIYSSFKSMPNIGTSSTYTALASKFIFDTRSLSLMLKSFAGRGSL